MDLIPFQVEGRGRDERHGFVDFFSRRLALSHLQVVWLVRDCALGVPKTNGRLVERADR